MPDGGRCPWTAKEVLGGIAMCARHKAMIYAEVAADVPEVAGAIGSVVYYIGDPVTRYIKIGTSTNLQVRMGKLRIERPGSLILATEPGSYPTERQRHAQFAHVSVGQTGRGKREWFRNEPDLARHVSAVRKQHGIIAPGRPLFDSYVAPWAEAA